MLFRILMAIGMLLTIVAVPVGVAPAEEVAEEEVLEEDEPELSLEERLARWGIPNADGSRIVSMPSELQDFTIANVFANNEFLFTVGDLDALPPDAFLINRFTGGDDYYFELVGVDRAKNALIVKSDPGDHVILIDLVDGHVIDNPLARQVRLRLVTTPWGLAFLCIVIGLLAGVTWLCLLVLRKSLGKNPRLR